MIEAAEITVTGVVQALLVTVGVQDAEITVTGARQAQIAPI